MRAFFRGLLLVIVVLLTIPFASGLILHLGSFEYFLAVVGAILILAALLLLVRGRISQGLLMLAISVIVLISSKNIIHFNGFNNLLYGSYYFGGMIIPMWLLILLVVLIVALAVRRN
jgi:hypothetical protein